MLKKFPRKNSLIASDCQKPITINGEGRCVGASHPREEVVGGRDCSEPVNSKPRLVGSGSILHTLSFLLKSKYILEPVCSKSYYRLQALNRISFRSADELFSYYGITPTEKTEQKKKKKEIHRGPL